VTAQTATASTVHEPVGRPGGPGLWHRKGLQLPPYIQHVANELRAQGHGESEAVEMAVGIIKDWAAGHDGHGNRVHPDVQAAAAKNAAQWEALKAGAGRAGRSPVTVTRAAMATADINDLPDSAFAYIEPGGSKDGSGKTVPRSLRHFPVHDKAHADNAAARIAQGAQFGKQALPKVRAAQKKFGEQADADDSGTRLDPYRPEYMRLYPLEDMHIIRSAKGGDGRTVEAFAAVFDEPAEIKDFEGHYVERIDPTAFNKVIADASRSRGGFPGAVKVLYNHGMTIQGTPSERFSMPIGVPVEIRAEARGLLTRTRYSDTPLAEEILENIRAGAVTSQSFTGRIVRSDPQLRRGERYTPYREQLPTVRRMELGLREYGPVLWPAYSGAEILGVRMSTPGAWEPDESLALPPDGEAAPGEPLPPLEGEDQHSARYHQHALYVLRSKEAREKVGLVW
jgi:HK97 family phage prohead protease